jgi:hypothetical protein
MGRENAFRGDLDGISCYTSDLEPSRRFMISIGQLTAMDEVEKPDLE